MKKRRKTTKAKLAIVTRVEEGIVLTKKDQERYQYIAISQNQIRQVIDSLSEVISAYQQSAEAITGAMKTMIDVQERMAKQMQDVFKGLEHFQKVSALIQIPKIVDLIPDLTNLNFISSKSIF